MSYFFSVCIPADGREKTIQKALRSVLDQSFRNFECIISINRNNELAKKEIKEFFASESFRENPFDYLLDENDIEKSFELSDWNFPLIKATGKYVAMLEGDDQFNKNYLENAYDVLEKNPTVGLYSSASQIKTVGSEFGSIDSAKAKELIYLMDIVPPPSQSIFLRKNPHGNEYRYNVHEYSYAAEMELYLNIALDGCSLFNNEEPGLNRRISDNKLKKTTLKYFSDKIFFHKKFRSNFSAGVVLKSAWLIQISVFKGLIKGLRVNKTIDSDMLKVFVLFESLLYVVKRRFSKEFFIVRLMFNIKNEKLVGALDIFKYFYSKSSHIRPGKRGLFPGKHYTDFTSNIVVKHSQKFVELSYKNMKFYYPGDSDLVGVSRNFNAILNEQSYENGNYSPHQYVANEKLKSSDVIYDIGAAEGFQSRVWLDSVAKIVIFEPDPKMFSALEMTFQDYIKLGNVILINEGVSDFKGQVKVFNKAYRFDTLDSLVKRFSLPLPSVIKADIEGHEMKFLQSAKSVLASDSMRLLQIAVYHRPEDSEVIPEFMKSFRGAGELSGGIMYFNRDFDIKCQSLSADTFSRMHQPVFRKCLYSHWF